MKNKIIYLGFLSGAVSGLLVYILHKYLNHISNFLEPSNLYYGVVYGAITGIFFCSYHNKKFSKFQSLFLWTLSGAISYVFAFLSVPLAASIMRPGVFAFSIPGCVGAFVLGICFSFIFNKISVRSLLLITLAGGIIATIHGYFMDKYFVDFEFIFIIWQSIITGLLAYFIKKL